MRRQSSDPAPQPSHRTTWWMRLFPETRKPQSFGWPPTHLFIPSYRLGGGCREGRVLGPSKRARAPKGHFRPDLTHISAPAFPISLPCGELIAPIYPPFGARWFNTRSTRWSQPQVDLLDGLWNGTRTATPVSSSVNNAAIPNFRDGSPNAGCDHQQRRGESANCTVSQITP